MTPDEYVKLAVKTEAKIKGSNEITSTIDLRLLHGMIGLCTEVGELQDAVKKYIFYLKELDISNIKEELGDILWYVALLCDTFDFSLENIMKTNIEKLKIRYPEKFTEENALNRDLEAERKTFETE